MLVILMVFKYFPSTLGYLDPRFSFLYARFPHAGLGTQDYYPSSLECPIVIYLAAANGTSVDAENHAIQLLNLLLQPSSAAVEWVFSFKEQCAP